MSDLATIHVTKALKQDYEFMRALVAVRAIDWIVVSTNPNCEERARASLSAAGLIGYLPLRSSVGVRRRGTRKKFDASRPLIPRYVFVGLDRSRGDFAEMVRSCHGVEKILSFADDRTPHLVPARQMQGIVEAAFEAQTNRDYVAPQLFSIGDRIRLVADSFKGLTGEVSAYDEAKRQVRAGVMMLGGVREVSVPVDKITRLD